MNALLHAVIALAALGVAEAQRPATEVRRDALSWVGKLDDAGLKTGPWRCQRSDGSLMFVGEFRADAPVGAWAFFHADGSFDPGWLSATYDGATRKPLMELSSELAATHAQHQPGLSRAPAPAALPELVAQVDAYAAGDDTLRERLFAHPQETCAAVLARLLRTDLSSEAGRSSAQRLNDELLVAMCSGAPKWVAGDSSEVLRANTLTILRWYSLWETTRTDDEVWSGRFDPRVNWLDPTINRFVFVDPPAPPGFRDRGRPNVQASRVSAFGRDPNQAPSPVSYSTRRSEQKRPKTDAMRFQDSVNEAMTFARSWLSAQQGEGGEWDPARHGGDERWTVAVTAECALALLAYGDAPNIGTRAGNCVTRALHWLMQAQDRETGRIAAKVETLFQHALATSAVAEGAGMSGAQRIASSAQLAVRYLGAQQLPDGSWPLEEGGALGDDATTCVALSALVIARMSEIPVEAPWIERALGWLDRRDRAGFQATPSTATGLAFRDADTARAWTFFLQVVGAQVSALDPTHAAQVEWLRPRLPTGKNVEPRASTEFTVAALLAAHQVGGDLWNDSFQAAAKSLMASQEREGALAGSWSPLQPSLGGRLHTTACCFAMLATQWRYPRVSARK